MRTVPIRCDKCGSKEMDYYYLYKYPLSIGEHHPRFLICPQCGRIEKLVVAPIVINEKCGFVHIQDT